MNFGKRIDKHSENFNKISENINKNQLGLKKIAKTKNTRRN